MLPVTPKGFRRYVRYNATRKGLLGGSKLWLGVYAAGRLRRFGGRITKTGPAPVVYSERVSSGHWTEIVNERPRPRASAVRAGAKASAKADRAARRAHADPSRANVAKAVRTRTRAAAANADLGSRRTPLEPLDLDRSQLSRRQRRRVAKSEVEALSILDKLDRKAIRDFP
ncbi:MAG: hypothetical protein OEW42_00910 [Acidimicrobiia bacterium]|nr:hypothetical protein [Acidimicrobiia bacterium]MDH5236463.1 hypothetical protein [Acidimicrobiia bacterium]